ncbi:probable serine/threonine-protein kinase pats1 [Saccostrea echinata]|uniref:probable serine/threonine-protein kinase pats1 n=1 Tax=Saccostrea echinata TaxID=191078 RepID=UPI002A835EB2|nr:probable serine/threonine-protein kinase pats1 [Saccostrea echinata]
MYKISQGCRVGYESLPFYITSYDTATRYLRSCGYTRKNGEKCVIGKNSFCEQLFILRLQINILTHVTMEDTGIYEELVQFLNTPDNKIRGSQSEREQFIEILKDSGEAVHYRGRSQDSVQNVTWFWTYEDWARPDIVRSCIGLHPHNDIYIIDNKAYRKPSTYHKYSEEVRSLLYSLLLCDKYTGIVNGEAFKSIMIKIREKYFQKLFPSNDVDVKHLQHVVKETQNGEVSFVSNDIRHDVMYAFVTECLVEDSDLEFFLITASLDVISEYCRSWEYKRSEGERCLYVPDRPEKMYDLFIDKLQLNIITHCTMSDRWIQVRISKRLKVPKEILRWDQKARERYVQYAEKGGVQEVHHARGMIVGCAGAGKTTLLNRLLKRSKKEIKKLKSTKGLEVHEEVFEICEEKGTLKVRETNKDGSEAIPDKGVKKTLSFFDFGGQCAYYACHQIYLTRRAFYIVVIDASKDLEHLVEKDVCDQMDTVFANWKYKDYFLFWMKSIHTYCYGNSRIDRDSDVIIILVATHWDKRVYKDKATFLDGLQTVLPVNSDLVQYIIEDRCFCTEFPIAPIKDLEEFLVQIAAEEKWSEQIPDEWVFFDEKIQKEKNKRVLEFDIIEKVFMHHEDEKQILNLAKDMLRYHHDAGKILHFNEEHLSKTVIIDVQWFVNAFKYIITDRNHVKGIVACRQDWEEFYKTGNLKDSLLSDIWNGEDERLLGTKTSSKNAKLAEDPRFLLYHKEELLLYMQRLGLISSEDQTHYVPSMNKRDFGETQKEIITCKRSNSKSSVLVYLFDFLPYFFFYRIVVALMQIENWNVLESDGIRSLYKDAAMFNHKGHNIVITVTPSTIQLQIFQPNSQMTMLHEVTLSIRKSVESILHSVTKSFHKCLAYQVGFICYGEENQILGREVSYNFVEESKVGSGSQMTCPRH